MPKNIFLTVEDKITRILHPLFDGMYRSHEKHFY